MNRLDRINEDTSSYHKQYFEKTIKRLGERHSGYQLYCFEDCFILRIKEKIKIVTESEKELLNCIARMTFCDITKKRLNNS